MKKTLLTLALVASSLAAFGQGKIQFGNDSNHYFVIGISSGGDVGGGISSTNGNTPSGTTGAIPVSPLPSGTSLEAVLYAGQTSTSMTLQTVDLLTGANWQQAGRMANKGVTLPFAGGSATFFDVFVMDSGSVLSSNTLPTSANAQVYFGSSGLFTAVPGTSISFVSMVGATSTWAPGNLVINAVPEPASFALAGLGAAAMLIFRRRK